MNNGQYATVKPDEVTEEAAAQTVTLTRKMVTLQKLLRNPDFKFFLKEFLEPRLREAEHKLRTSAEIDLFRAQGAVGELEFMLKNLDSTLQSLRNTTSHDQDQ